MKDTIDDGTYLQVAVEPGDTVRLVPGLFNTAIPERSRASFRRDGVVLQISRSTEADKDGSLDILEIGFPESARPALIELLLSGKSVGFFTV